MGTWAMKREATSIPKVNSSLRRRSEILKASIAAVSRGALSMGVFHPDYTVPRWRGLVGSLAETPCGNLQPPVESLTVRWKRDGPDRLAQSARGFSQADGAPGLGHRQRPGETFDAVRGRQVVPGLAGQTKALGKCCAGAPGIALGQRMLRQKIQRP